MQVCKKFREKWDLDPIHAYQAIYGINLQILKCIHYLCASMLWLYRDALLRVEKLEQVSDTQYHLYAVQNLGR